MIQATESKKVRVFFALWPTAEERSALAQWQTSLHELTGGRVMLDNTLHATLVFVGAIDPERLEALRLAASEVVSEGFELRLAQARYWGHNGIVYAAPDRMSAPLMLLVERLEQCLRRHHFQFEQRPHKPHVTLLRNALWTDRSLPPMQPVRWQMGDFVLVLSHPEHGVANYQVLARFPLLPSEA